jgi:hypothetical protein
MLQYFSRVVRDDGLAVPEPFLSSSGEASSAQVPILSSSGDAFGAQVSTIAHEDNEKGMKKKRKRDSSVFHSLVLEKTGLVIVPAPKRNGRQYSTCTHKPCVTEIQNLLDRWVRHRKVCEGKAARTLTAQTMMIACTAGGDIHRKKTCDILTTSYWLYKRKAPFATAPHIKEVFFVRFMTSYIKFLHEIYSHDSC